MTSMLRSAFILSTALHSNAHHRHTTALHLILQYHLHHIHIVDLATARIHRLQQLIHLIIAHLLAEVGQDVSELPDADETRQVLVEDLEAAAVLVGLAGVAEAAWAVEDAGEGIKVD